MEVWNGARFKKKKAIRLASGNDNMPEMKKKKSPIVCCSLNRI